MPARYRVIEKEIGQTPLEAIVLFKQAHPEYGELPASYAGRLDPMASGKLLILFGEECKHQKEYTNLDKEYEIEVLLEVGSDTGDVLGLVTVADTQMHLDSAALEKALRAEQGAHMRAYPVFSSKTVAGKPLFLYALEERLTEIEVPEHEEVIHRISYKGRISLSAAELQGRIASLFALAPVSTEPSKVLGADFRIVEVRKAWNQVFTASGDRNFTVIRLRVVCGSGSYMRSLAGRIGESLGTKGLALSIRRTRVGRYVPITNSIGFWRKEY